MKTTRTAGTASIRFALVLCALALASGVPVSGVEGNEMIVIKMREIGTYNHAGGYGPSNVTGSGGTVLPLGTTGSVYITMGAFAEDGSLERSMCTGGSGSALDDEDRKNSLIAKRPHVWWADVRPLASDVGEITIEVDWAHYFKDHRDAAERVVAGDSRRITMKEGERHVLDFIDSGPEAACRSTLIEVTASIQEDPALENELLGYDLWFQHTDAEGVVTARRFQATGQQGEELDFRFTPLRFAVPGAVLDDGSGVDAILEVFGTIQGRIRPDGSIDVRLGAARWVDAERKGTPRRGGIGGGGTKVFSAESGETVSMVLPAPGGRCGVSSKTTAKVQGSTEPPDPKYVWVDNKEFYAGHQDELILTVTRDH